MQNQNQNKKCVEFLPLSCLTVSSHALMMWRLENLIQTLPSLMANFLILGSVVEQSMFHSICWFLFCSYSHFMCFSSSSYVAKWPLSFGCMWKQNRNPLPHIALLSTFIPLLDKENKGKTHLPDRRPEMTSGSWLPTDRS